MEYCFTQDGTLGGGGMLVACRPGTQGAWGHDLDYNLGTVDGGSYATVYGEYRLVVGSDGNYVAYPSYPSSASVYVYVASTSGVSLNTPAGLLNHNYPTAFQPQYLNYAVGQWVSWWVWSPQVTQVAVTACTSPSSCPAAIGTFNVPTYSTSWAPSTAQFPIGGYIHFGLFATGSTPPFTFQQLVPGSPSGITCGPVGQSGTMPCAVLADGTADITGSSAGEMPGDPPSGAIAASTCNNTNPLVFSGYADPSMRADALSTPSNPLGKNLYMTYSWPENQVRQNSDLTTNCTPAIEIHLAASKSIGAGGYPGGWQWACDLGSCPPATPLFPSPTTAANSGNLPVFTGTNWVLCTAALGCAGGHSQGDMFQVSGVYYSSHEVSNLAQYVAGNTAYWYAVHLMYFVPEGYSVLNGLVNGCLVISGPASSPGALAWPNYTDENPASCDPSLANWAAYTNSYPLQFGSSISPPPPPSSHSLNYLSGQSCNTWGEPAIMVAPSPSGSIYSGQTWLYLAAECFTIPPTTDKYVGSGYYVFYNPIGANGAVSPSGWAAYPPAADNKGSIMNFTVSNLPSNTPGAPYPNTFFLTEFDWAVRADNSIVAVAVPEMLNSAGPPTVGPCFALTFDLYEPYNSSDAGNPFLAYIASVADTDTQTLGTYGATESTPNGCTYDANSNTGVTIVRHLVNPSDPTQYQTYSIVNSGVMP